MRETLDTLLRREDLTEARAADAMDQVMQGGLDEVIDALAAAGQAQRLAELNA